MITRAWLYVTVIGEKAVMRLGGIDGIRNEPTTRGGIIVMKSKWFSLANSVSI